MWQPANPRAILTADPYNFTLLSKLLSAPVDVAARAWELLMRLPTNPDTQRAIGGIASSSSPDDAPLHWPSLIDASSPYRLLYALQIVETLTDASDGDGDATVTAVNREEDKPAAAPAAGQASGDSATGVCHGCLPAWWCRLLVSVHTIFSCWSRAVLY